MEQSRFTCRSCGQHFETKSDLRDHELNCQGVGLGQAQGQGETQNQGQSRKQQTGKRTSPAGSGGSEDLGA